MVNSMKILLEGSIEDAICGYMIKLACNGVKNPLRDKLLSEFEILLRIIENCESFINGQEIKLEKLTEALDVKVEE